MFFLFSFLFSCLRFNFNFWWGNRIRFVINIIVILDKCLFCGCTLCFCWSFYISILDEFMYKLQLKSNAEIIVFFDVITQQKIYLVLIQLFQVKTKFSVRTLSFHLLIMISTIFLRIRIPAYLLKFPYSDFDHSTISKRSVLN